MVRVVLPEAIEGGRAVVEVRLGGTEFSISETVDDITLRSCTVEKIVLVGKTVLGAEDRAPLMFGTIPVGTEAALAD
jgi:hypothetical protein